MNSRPGLTTPILIAALVLCATLFLPQTAFAGNGKFKDGKFDFCISVRFNASAAQLQQIRTVFEDASRVLNDATDGHHRFGTITLVNNSGAGQAADFWILPGSGRAYAPFFGDINYGVWGQHVTLYYNSNFGDTSLGDGLAYTIVHEFGHLAYGLNDEYSGPNLFSGFAAECAAPDTAPATLSFCIMDNYFARGTRVLSSNYSLNEFCSASNHDKAAAGNPGSANNTWQHFWHGKSCWQSIAANPKWPIPAPDPPIDQEGLSVIPTQQSGSPDKRFMLLLDRSGSMQDPGSSFVDSKMSVAQWAANGFITYAPDGMNIGVASFADSGILNFFMAPITPSNRGQAITAVNGLQALGGTNIGHGLQIALAEIQAQTDPCCAQGIVLISDGDHNTGTHPSAVIPALVDAGVAVFTIGLGTSITANGEATLQSIASQTRGKYYRVHTPALLPQTINGILYAEALGSGASSQAPLPISNGQVKEVPVEVEQGTTRASFIVSKLTSTDSFSMLLRTPSGVLINPNDGAGGNPNIRFSSDNFSSGFQIFSPAAGTWTIIITAGTISTGALNVQGLMEHEGTKLSASVRNPLANYPQPLQIIASAEWEGERVLGGTITGRVIHPQGASVPITLFDDGNMAAHGDAIAGDGVFSENFDYVQQFGVNYRNGSPVAGSYTIELTATVTNGTKYPGEVDLFAGPPPAPIAVPNFIRLVTTTAIIANVPADTTAPSCQPTACNSTTPASCDITVQDSGVGLSLITVTTSSNVNVSIPPFSAGSTSPVVVTGTLIDPNSNGSFALQCFDVLGNVSTCSRTVTIAPPPILSDNFNDNVIDTAKWSTTNSFTGFTSLLVPIAETSQQVEIGPLLQTISNQYRGLRSMSSFDFTGSNSFVELVQAPSSVTDAEAQFSVGNNISNISLYYRIFVRNGTIFGERKTSATAKVTLFSIPYDAVAHRFLRIRHNSITGAVLLETAPGSGGVPGAWVTHYTEPWHSSVPRTSVLIEMRGGTFKQETTAPGKVIFDNFAFALNGP